MAEPVLYAELDLRCPSPNPRSHLNGRFSRTHMLLFGAFLVICVGIGFGIVYLQVQVSSLQCPNNALVITERPPENGTTPGGGNACPSGARVCSDGWLLLNLRCYYFSEERKSWPESFQLCRSVQAELAAIRPTQNILMGYVQSLQGEFWVGLKKERRDRYPGELWYWTDNRIEENIKEENSNKCAKIGRALSAESCMAPHHWICEREAKRSDTQS